MVRWQLRTGSIHRNGSFFFWNSNGRGGLGWINFVLLHHVGTIPSGVPGVGPRNVNGASSIALLSRGTIIAYKSQSETMLISTDDHETSVWISRDYEKSNSSGQMKSCRLPLAQSSIGESKMHRSTCLHVFSALLYLAVMNNSIVGLIGIPFGTSSTFWYACITASPIITRENKLVDTWTDIQDSVTAISRSNHSSSMGQKVLGYSVKSLYFIQREKTHPAKYEYYPSKCLEYHLLLLLWITPQPDEHNTQKHMNNIWGFQKDWFMVMFLSTLGPSPQFYYNFILN